MKNILLLPFLFLSLYTYGQTWEEINQGNVSDISGYGDTLHMVGNQVNNGNTNYFYGISTDGGSTWNKTTLTPFMSVEGVPISVGFFNNTDGIIGIKGNFTEEYLKTSDGGLTWQKFNPSTSQGIFQPYDIIILDESTAIITAFKSGKYIITYDKGNTWSCQCQFSTAWIPNFEVINSSLFFNYDSNTGIYKSTDGGMNWSVILNTRDITAFSMENENSGYAIVPQNSIDNNGNTVTTPNLYKTTDGWGSYETIPLIMLQDKYIGAFTFVNSQEFYFFNNDDIYYSGDGGQTIRLLQTIDFDPFRINKIQDAIFATGRGLAKLDPNGVISNILEDDSINEELIIYPNPITENQISINSDEFTSYSLYDLTGRFVESGVINNGVIELKPLSKQFYFLSLENIDTIKTLKIVVE
ncbi:T9SS type A sorting domain-containing protein [Aquimarina algiphila]|uniref:T9SS type A sorting domain-containing protein n=1 Tax=Aquimarina algiphila TaxID=2047982 RepID=UPI002492B904|nr:T9SS type A sorting domain-containing protein [Aquimarina algiphila]